jgi:hypothetical protein
MPLGFNLRYLLFNVTRNHELDGASAPHGVLPVIIIPVSIQE